MAVEFRLPDVGEGLHEAEIVTWLVRPGDVVGRDQPLVEVLTDKAQVQLPSPYAGTIVSLGAAEGDLVAVGSVLVVFDGVEGGPPRAPSAPPARTAQATAPVAVAAESLPPPVESARRRVKASPAVRHLAVEFGADLAAVIGTGPEGRVTADDVRAMTASPTTRGPAAEAPAALVPARPRNLTLGQMAPGTHPLRGIRRRSAEVMAQSWTSIPHITCLDEADATALADARDQLRNEADQTLAGALTFTPFLVAAVAQALRALPAMNASLSADATSVTVHDQVNVGVAVATNNGLIVPVVRDADRRRLGDLAREIARLTAAARGGSITPADIADGTATVTNYGALGGRFATPLIRPPEVVIVGFGAIRSRPIVIANEVVARRTLPISISCDHRVVDGDLATAFLERVKQLVTAPILLTGAL